MDLIDQLCFAVSMLDSYGTHISYADLQDESRDPNNNIRWHALEAVFPLLLTMNHIQHLQETHSHSVAQELYRLIEDIPQARPCLRHRFGPHHDALFLAEQVQAVYDDDDPDNDAFILLDMVQTELFVAGRDGDVARAQHVMQRFPTVSLPETIFVGAMQYRDPARITQAMQVFGPFFTQAGCNLGGSITVDREMNTRLSRKGMFLIYTLHLWKSIIECGFNVNTIFHAWQRRTFLHGAVHDLDVDMVRFLVEHGADVHARDVRGSEPIHLLADKLTDEEYAGDAYENAKSILDILLHRHANINSVNNDSDTLLQRVFDFDDNEPNFQPVTVEFARLLMYAGADPTIPNIAGRNAVQVGGPFLRRIMHDMQNSRLLFDVRKHEDVLYEKLHRQYTKEQEEEFLRGHLTPEAQASDLGGVVEETLALPDDVYKELTDYWAAPSLSKNVFTA